MARYRRRSDDFLPEEDAPLFDAAAVDVLLDTVAPPDAFERLAGDRRGAGRRTHRSAGARAASRDEFDVSALGEDTIAGVAIDLQNAYEACQIGDPPLGLTIGA
jgi:hypothetical protein